MSKISLSGRARIVRALELSELYIHNYYPVDSSNSNLVPLSSLSKLPRLKDRKGSELVYRNRYVNYQYRFLFKALVIWQNQSESQELYFVTVTFNKKTENRYLNKAKPAKEFGQSLRRKLELKGFGGRFFFVLEKEPGTESKLHMHMLCACDDTGKAMLEKALQSYADTTKTAILFQKDYLLPHSAQKYVSVLKNGVPTEVISAEWGLLEDDPDSPYELNSKGNQWFAREPVNVGAADYMSKHDKVWKRKTGSRCLYAPFYLIQEANKLHASNKEIEENL